MANWYGAWRTSYVKLRQDRIRHLARFPVQLVTNEEGHTAILSEDEGGEPTLHYDDISEVPDFLEHYVEDQEWIDLMSCIHEFLEPDEVIIIMCSGAEKLRYITGYALAVHSRGEDVSINLNHIYKEAQEAFPDANITEATY